MIAWEHALALVLLVGFPLWDVLETRALKTSTNPRRKYCRISDCSPFFG
jgi:hypothetical protein